MIYSDFSWIRRFNALMDPSFIDTTTLLNIFELATGPHIQAYNVLSFFNSSKDLFLPFSRVLLKALCLQSSRNLPFSSVIFNPKLNSYKNLSISEAR